MRRRVVTADSKPKTTALDSLDRAIVMYTAVPVHRPAKLVTLDNPDEGTSFAQDAFARLRPGEDMTADEVASWRDSVAAVARAVRVLPQPKAATVPLAAERAGEDVVGTLREEALALARETKSDDVVTLTQKILDEVGA